MVSWIDILPTLVDVAGGAPPGDIDGRSFAGVLRGEKKEHRDRIFTTHSGDGRMNVYPTRSVRTQDWKYIRNLHPEYLLHAPTSISCRPTMGQAISAVGRRRQDRPRCRRDREALSRTPGRGTLRPHFGSERAEESRTDSKHSTRLAAMRAEVDAWMKEQGDTGQTYNEPRLLSDPKRAEPPPAKKKK